MSESSRAGGSGGVIFRGDPTSTAARARMVRRAGTRDRWTIFELMPIGCDRGWSVPGAIILLVTAIFTAWAVGSHRDGERQSVDDLGIGPCPSHAEEDLLSSAALQCWFQARLGRWRTLSQVSANGVLVVEIEAAKILDAQEIAQRFVATERDQFVEILVYVQHNPTSTRPLVRRVRWTPREGFETREFSRLSVP